MELQAWLPARIVAMSESPDAAQGTIVDFFLEGMGEIRACIRPRHRLKYSGLVQALAPGMSPLSKEAKALLRIWVLCSLGIAAFFIVMSFVDRSYDGFMAAIYGIGILGIIVFVQILREKYGKRDKV